ncbi:MAG TPA: CoA transferase [Desulfotomaculum sp.]|nr:CoA transferase [Desulfotomaculum sp.]
MATPLEGIKVLDLTRLLPGPHTSLMLADFGAEVIKIEETGRGDYLRELASGKVGDTGGLFLLINRNKKSMTLNLKKEAGQEIFYRLVKGADILIEGYRPGITKRFKIDYETLREINPGIIYCSLSGYGKDGPYAQKAGHDINYISYGGVLGMTARPGEKPVIPAINIADTLGGTMMALVGILLALQARQRTGKGQFVDISMLDGTIFSIAPIAAEYFSAGIPPKCGKTQFTGAFACFSVYETRDKEYLGLGAGEPHFWVNLCKYFQKEEYIPYQYVEEKQEEIISFFEERFKQRTRAEWTTIFEDVDVCCTPVYNLAETFTDPQVVHRQMVFEMEHPRLGKLKQIGCPIKLSDTPAEFNVPPPEMGEHTLEILSQLGYLEAEIASFKKEGVI